MSDAYRRSVRLLLAGNDPSRALALWECYRAAELRARSAAATQPHPAAMGPDDLSRIARSIHTAPGSRLISYFEDNDSLTVWNANTSEISMSRLPYSRPEVTSLARRFAETVADPASTPEEANLLGREIYEKLIAPCRAAWFEGGTVFVETDGATSLIPFEAIPLPDGHYLGDRVTIAYSPGALFAGTRSTTVSADAPPRILAVGVSHTGLDRDGRLPALADAVPEASAVASLSPRGILLTDEGATSAAILRELASATVFHFAGHAIATSETSGLILGGGFWSANDLPSEGLRQCHHPLLHRGSPRAERTRHPGRASRCRAWTTECPGSRPGQGWRPVAYPECPHGHGGR